MAIIISTNRPRGLLAAIRESVDDGSIRTWAYDADGDFTHTAEQWKNRAWLRPRHEEGSLILNVLTPKGQSLSADLYAIYHGRFIEMLLAHFDQKFARATASALPTSPDRVKG